MVQVLSSLRLLRPDLLSSTPGITVVGGFPFSASAGSPFAFPRSAGNGRTSTAPSGSDTLPSLAHCQNGFYGGQPTSYPASHPSGSWSLSPHVAIGRAFIRRLRGQQSCYARHMALRHPKLIPPSTDNLTEPWFTNCGKCALCHSGPLLLPCEKPAHATAIRDLVIDWFPGGSIMRPSSGSPMAR